MADKQQMMERRHLHMSTKTAVLTSVAGVIIGGPLVGLMGLSFVATMSLLLLSSPLLIIFSPVLLGAALAMIGFAVAGAMAVAGLSSVAWVFRNNSITVAGTY